MKNDLFIKEGIIIPEHELEITASRAGGAGGQHVNKTSTRITVRWNVKTTNALTQEQKEHIIQKLHTRLTTEGDLIVHSSVSRSQAHNKELALSNLAKIIRSALHKPKKRKPTKIPKAIKESFLQEKKHRSTIKKMRSKKFHEQ